MVRKTPGESEKSLIARFRRRVIEDKILLELKEREYYKPPSVRKKERLSALQRRRGRK